MTSKLTKEWLQHQISAIEAVGITDSNTLAAFKLALAAMDSEPVAEVYQAPNIGICAALGPSIRMLCPLEPGTKLYRHAQQPVVPVLPQRIPDSVYDFLQFALGDRAWSCADLLWSECCKAIESGGKS
ncbi:TPA: hypothetical protein ACF3PC_003409 [Klebsiella pneumoniae]